MFKLCNFHFPAMIDGMVRSSSALLVSNSRVLSATSRKSRKLDLLTRIRDIRPHLQKTFLVTLVHCPPLLLRVVYILNYTENEASSEITKIFCSTPPLTQRRPPHLSKRMLPRPIFSKCSCTNSIPLFKVADPLPQAPLSMCCASPLKVVKVRGETLCRVELVRVVGQ